MMNHTCKILYLGHHYGTSLNRCNALRRLGHEVELLDPWKFFPKGKYVRRIFQKLVFEIGAAPLEPYIHRRLVQTLKGRFFDVMWNDQSELVGLQTVQSLKAITRRTVTYAADDPFGPRDRKRFSLYRNALVAYDLFAVVREPNIEEARHLGVKTVVRVLHSADEVEHTPLTLSCDDLEKWRSETAFIGTWMPERGPFLAHLLDLGVPLAIYGDRWSKAREWPLLRKAWRGPGIVGQHYVKAIQSAKICLGLLSKGNRDLHTTRSAEIPYIGSLFCAERTVDHRIMYREDKEAVFWSTPEECAVKCFELLTNEPKRQAIALAGRQRCIKGRYLNETVTKQILDALPLSK